MATDYGRITEALVVLLAGLDGLYLDQDQMSFLSVNIGRVIDGDNELFALVKDENDETVAAFWVRVERVEVAG